MDGRTRINNYFILLKTFIGISNISLNIKVLFVSHSWHIWSFPGISCISEQDGNRYRKWDNHKVVKMVCNMICVLHSRYWYVSIPTERIPHL